MVFTIMALFLGLSSVFRLLTCDRMIIDFNYVNCFPHSFLLLDASSSLIMWMQFIFLFSFLVSFLLNHNLFP